MSLKVHSLDGLEGAQTTGKALLACVSGLMSLQMAQVPMHLEPTDLTFTEDAFTMNLLHMSAKFILVSKWIATDCALYRFPRWLAGRGGNSVRGRGTERRGNGEGSGGNLDLDGRNLFTRGEGLRVFSGDTRFGILDGDGF